ncbi:MAG TPA: hypothetical protein VEH76_02560 [Methylocystis sp.]|nr:hypothetical protein [Methylocystis sp.]
MKMQILCVIAGLALGASEAHAITGGPVGPAPVRGPIVVDPPVIVDPPITIRRGPVKAPPGYNPGGPNIPYTGSDPINP